MANGRCYVHGGMSPGAKKGNQNARKHGFYSAEAIADRQAISTAKGHETAGLARDKRREGYGGSIFVVLRSFRLPLCFLCYCAFDY
jgi:hypothetical protein